MANVVSLGGRSRYLGPENPYKARRQAITADQKMRNSVGSAGQYGREALSNLQMNGQYAGNPSENLQSMSASVLTPRDYANQVEMDAASRMKDARQMAERDAARRGKILSPSDIRKLAMSGALGRASEANRAMLGSQNARFNQLGQIERFNQSNQNRELNYDSRAAGVAQNLDQLQMQRANAYDRMSTDDAGYYGIARRRGGTFQNVIDPNSQNVQQQNLNPISYRQQGVQTQQGQPQQPGNQMVKYNMMNNNSNPIFNGVANSLGQSQQNQIINQPTSGGVSMQSAQQPIRRSAVYNQQQPIEEPQDRYRPTTDIGEANPYTQQVRDQVRGINRSLDRSFNTQGGYTTTAGGYRAVDPSKVGVWRNATGKERRDFANNFGTVGTPNNQIDKRLNAGGGAIVSGGDYGRVNPAMSIRYTDKVNPGDVTPNGMYVGEPYETSYNAPAMNNEMFNKELSRYGKTDKDIELSTRPIGGPNGEVSGGTVQEYKTSPTGRRQAIRPNLKEATPYMKEIKPKRNPADEIKEFNNYIKNVYKDSKSPDVISMEDESVESWQNLVKEYADIFGYSPFDAERYKDIDKEEKNIDMGILHNMQKIKQLESGKKERQKRFDKKVADAVG